MLLLLLFQTLSIVQYSEGKYWVINRSRKLVLLSDITWPSECFRTGIIAISLSAYCYFHQILKWTRRGTASHIQYLLVRPEITRSWSTRIPGCGDIVSTRFPEVSNSSSASTCFKFRYIHISCFNLSFSCLSSIVLSPFFLLSLCQVSISFITATNHIALHFVHSLYQISASNRSSRAYILCTGF